VIDTKWKPRWVTMTDIELNADVAIHHAYDVKDRDKDHLRVRIPLDGHVSLDWIRWYQRLARVRGIAAHAEDQPDRSWVIVDVPAYVERDRIRALMDNARGLMAETDAAVERPPPMAETEFVVRDWWSEQSR